MKKNDLRKIAAIILGFIALWYAGAMFDFFPFAGDDLAIRAVGFTGLLLCAAIVLCACWIIEEIRKRDK